jgi:hypothetical protein
MTSIKELPKSLVDSVSNILEKSVKVTTKVHNSIASEGLKKFGVSKVESLTEAQKKQYYSWLQLRLQEAACGCGEDVAEDDMPGDAPFHKDGNEDSEKKKEIDEEEAEDEIKESVALDADELAVNGAVGVTDVDEQYPVHADVIKDSSPLLGTTEYRLFAQFNTNTLPQIVPPVTLPGAPSVDALRSVVEGLPWFCQVCEKALTDAADLPHQRPEHAGVVSEAAVISDVDRKRVALIRRIFSNSKVYILENNRVYQVTIHSDKEQGKEVELEISLDPSPKAVGKFVWKASQNRAGYQGAPELTPHADVISTPFLPGDAQKSVQALQTLLNTVSSKIRAGEYEFDDSL